LAFAEFTLEQLRRGGEGTFTAELLLNFTFFGALALLALGLRQKARRK
jgi:hypothetical protein